MKIERRKISDLKPADYNPRTISETALRGLASSVRRFGLVEPLIYNERTGNVVGGHQRLKILTEQGVAETDCVIVDLPPAEERALNVSLNNPRIQGEFTSDLSAIIGSLHSDLPDLPSDLALDDLLVDIPVDETPHRSLQADFVAPPFSVLDARQGYWQDRKASWLALGLRSEDGRGEHLGGGAGQGTLNHISEGLSPELAQRFAASGAGASIFDPVLCEVLYSWFTGKGQRVLDPFCGGSVRGVVAAKLGREYVGVDLREQQVAANERQWADMKLDGPAPRWVTGDSRNLQALAAGEYDFVFSCPPYADLERYSDDPNDLSTMEYDDFINAYREIIACSCSLLKQDRFAAFVVGDIRDSKGNYRNFVSDTIGAFRDAGLHLYNEAILVTPVGSLPVRTSSQFPSGRKLGKTHQNVLIFVKGDWRAAVEACGDVEINFTPAPEAAQGRLDMQVHES